MRRFRNSADKCITFLTERRGGAGKRKKGRLLKDESMDTLPVARIDPSCAHLKTSLTLAMRIIISDALEIFSTSYSRDG